MRKFAQYKEDGDGSVSADRNGGCSVREHDQFDSISSDAAATPAVLPTVMISNGAATSLYFSIAPA